MGRRYRSKSLCGKWEDLGGEEGEVQNDMFMPKLCINDRPGPSWSLFLTPLLDCISFILLFILILGTVFCLV